MKNIRQRVMSSMIACCAIFACALPSFAASSKLIPIASIPRATHVLTTETIAGQKASVLYLNNVAENPDYKWEFLSSGLRTYIDHKDGLGWIPLVTGITAQPEYQMHSGGNWQHYQLAASSGFSRHDQSDGSITMIQTYSTGEEGIAETLTEQWTIPANTEDFGTRGIKVSYSMTKNNPDPWRLNWHIKGLSTIAKTKTDERDSLRQPIVKKAYDDGKFMIDVSDFVKSQNGSDYSYSEDSSTHESDILFYKNGTTGDRVVDPTAATTGIAVGWLHNKQRNVFYNGTNFFVVYFKNSTSIFYKAASTVAGLSSAGEQTLIGTVDTGSEWDIYMVNDTKFDIGYSASSKVNAQTCTISGTSISCGGAPATPTAGSSDDKDIAIARAPFANRVYIYNDGQGAIFSATAGDLSSSSTWTSAGNTSATTTQESTMVPFANSDKVLFIYGNSGGGIASTTVTPSTVAADTAVGSGAINAVAKFGNAIRISDTDFRFAYIDASATTKLIEAQYNATSWAITTVIDSAGSQANPSLFYDGTGNTEYAFYTDASSPKTIQEYTKPTASTYSTAWASKTNVGDTTGSNADSLAVTQLIEPPPGSSRTTPRQLTWGFLRANSTNVDIMVGNIGLTPSQIGFSNAAVNVTAGTCNTLTVQLQNAAGTATNPSATTTVTMSSNSPAGQFTTDNTCNTGRAATATLTYTTSQSSQTIYYYDTRKSASTWTVTATQATGSDTITAGTQAETITAGAVSQLILTFPGQAFTDGTGNSGAVTAQAAGVSFTITKISATDAYLNIATYTGAKTLVYSGASNSPTGTAPTYTTAVTFSSGQSTTTLTTTLYNAQNTLLQVTESGQTYGVNSSTLVVNPGSICSATNRSIVTTDATGQTNTPKKVTVRLQDSWGNPVFNVSPSNISLSATATTATLQQPSIPTDNGGTVNGFISWSTTGAKTVTATISTVTLLADDGTHNTCSGSADGDGKLDSTASITMSGRTTTTGILFKGRTTVKGRVKLN